MQAGEGAGEGAPTNKADENNSHEVCLKWALPLPEVVHVLTHWHSEGVGQLRPVC